MTKLTRQDLQAARESEYRQGSWGYEERDVCGANKALRERGDRIVLEEANRQGWTENHLVAWVDSKYGRWFWDSLYGCSDEAGARKLVTLDWMAEYEREEYGI